MQRCADWTSYDITLTRDQSVAYALDILSRYLDVIRPSVCSMKTKTPCNCMNENNFLQRVTHMSRTMRLRIMYFWVCVERWSRPYLLCRAAVSFLRLLEQAVALHKPVRARCLCWIRPVAGISVQKFASGILRHGRPVKCGDSPHCCNLSLQFLSPPEAVERLGHAHCQITGKHTLRTQPHPMDLKYVVLGRGLMIDVINPL